jgi:hypothetical protein
MNHSSLGFWKGALAALLVVSAGACGGDDGGGNGGTPDAAVSNTGMYTRYVNSQLKVGGTPNESLSFAFDVDGNGEEENVLGGLLASLKGLAQIDIDVAVQEALVAGDFIILHSIRSDSLSADTSAQWQIWLGAEQAMPKLDGTGTFTVASNSPQNARLQGAITGGKFSNVGTVGATVILELSLIPDEPALQVTVNAAYIEADLTANGCTNGRIGGAIKAEDLIEEIVPLLASQLNARIEADAGCKQDINMCEQSNKTILGFFDTPPKDQVISEAELMGNVLIQSAFTPDVDVLNAAGQPYASRSDTKDNVRESVSIALGFQCAKGTFVGPGEN